MIATSLKELILFLRPLMVPRPRIPRTKLDLNHCWTFHSRIPSSTHRLLLSFRPMMTFTKTITRMKASSTTSWTRLMAVIVPTQLSMRLETRQVSTLHTRIHNREATRACFNAVCTPQLRSSPFHTAGKNQTFRPTINRGNATSS